MDNIDARQTHLSRLFFTDDRVYKQLKPVETPFVSFVDPARRITAATREFDLNQRLAPDVYLGTADIDEFGELVDRMIVMRRLPDSSQLSALITSGELNEDETESVIREVARHIATIHAAEPPVSGRDAETASAHTLRTRWQENFEALLPLVGNVIDGAEYEAMLSLVERFLAGRSLLFQERISDGWVRDGHGDLRTDHVYCLDDGPRLIDCLAFRDDFRIADVLNDIAFLAMDLHRLAGPEAAAQLMHYYHEFTNEHHQAALAHHYVAYRAHVRAKIAAIRLAQGDADAAAEVLCYHRLAQQHLDVGRVRLVAVGGSIGVGKSSVAEGLAERLGAVWLRTDEVRRTVGSGPPSYDLPSREAVYQEMLREAQVLLARGESVVLDATWSDSRHRIWMRDLAFRTESELTEIQVQLPLPVALTRLERRQAAGIDPSDATPDVARHFHNAFNLWPEATSVDNSGPLQQTIEQSLALVTAEHRSPAASQAATPFRPLGVGDGNLTDGLTDVDGESPAAVRGGDVLSYESIRFYLRRARYLVPSPDTE